MHDAIDLLNAIKKSAAEAMEASQPSDFCFGTVTSDSPLKIRIKDKMVLTPAQLVLTRNVTEFKTKVSLEWDTEEADSHKHELKIEKKEIKFHNQLNVGEKVVLLKQKGGQKYLVIDRVVNA